MTTCAICGEREATTRDHVPPKGIFPKPRPANLVTVPACIDCNNGASDYDDLFKVFLSLQASTNNGIARLLFEEKTVRTLERNQSLLAKIREESRVIGIESDGGKIETRTGVLWDSVAHDAVIARTIRGLYFHHTGSPMPKTCNLSVQFFREIPEDVLQYLHLFHEVRIGENQVIYKYIIFEEEPEHSLWLLEFYGAHWAGGHSSPITPY